MRKRKTGRGAEGTFSGKVDDVATKAELHCTVGDALSELVARERAALGRNNLNTLKQATPADVADDGVLLLEREQALAQDAAEEACAGGELVALDDLEDLGGERRSRSVESCS